MIAGAVIAAAGRGSRMGLEREKQFLPLLGVPILARSINIFTGHAAVQAVVAALPPGREEEALELIRPYCRMEKVMAVAGGDTRQQSVYRGLQALPEEIELVCVHDAARPLASAALLEKLLLAAAEAGAAIPGLPPADTLKEIDKDGFVTATPLRSSLRRAQTPQVFRRELLEAAYEEAIRQGVEATDDAALAELAGYRVLTVAGEEHNLKITSPLDLALAELILKGERHK